MAGLVVGLSHTTRVKLRLTPKESQCGVAFI